MVRFNMSESCSHAILRLYALRSPVLSQLLSFSSLCQAGKLDCRFKTIFPRTTEGEERLFQLLKKVYLESGFALDYKVSKEDLECLSERVIKLRALNEQTCKEKIESF
jgi:uncharacterized protein